MYLTRDDAALSHLLCLQHVLKSLLPAVSVKTNMSKTTYTPEKETILTSLVRHAVADFTGDGGSLPSGRQLQRPADQWAQVYQKASVGGGEGPEAGAAGCSGGEAEGRAGAGPAAEGGGESPGADEQHGGSSAGHSDRKGSARNPGPGNDEYLNFFNISYQIYFTKYFNTKNNVNADVLDVI